MESPRISAGIILCAGLSTRMKDFKPLLPLGEEPRRTLIECTIDSMAGAGIDHIVLVVGHRGKDIEQAILHRNYPFVTTVYNPRYAGSDMMESLRVGISQALRWPLESVFVLPGDMPKINPRTYTALLRHMRAHPCKVLIPSYRGEPAHPPLIHASCLEYLLHEFDGGGGLQAALNAFLPETVYLPVDDRGCTMDADYPDDYSRLLHYEPREPESLIDETVTELAEKLRGHEDAAVLLRRLFDGLAEKLPEHTATDHITAPNAVLEVVDEDTGTLYRRYLELGYEENDNGIRLTGENLAGEETGIVFLSETALKKMHELRGAGADTPRCKED